MTVWLAALACVVAMVVGCGDDGAPAGDGGHDGGVDGGSADGSRPPAPVPPEPPRFTPCPAGWREVTDDETPDVVRCEPWPASGRPECGETEMFLPGSAGCEPIAPACPLDGFPVGLPVGTPVTYVRAGATGGDGTHDLPFGTISEAIAVAEAGSIVAIAAGAYVERVDVETPLTLVGGCVDADIVGDVFASGSLQVRSLGARSLTVSNGTLHVEDALIHDSLRAGVTILTSHATIEHTAFRRMSVAAIDAASSETELSHVLVDHAMYGAFGNAGGTLTVTDSAVVTVGEGNSGVAILASDGTAGATSTRFERVALDNLFSTGLYAVSGAALELRDVIVRSNPDNPVTDVGIFAAGGSLTYERVFLDGPSFQGAGAGDDGSTLTLTDVLIRGVRPDADSGRGEGVEAAAGATGTLTRVVIERSTGLAVLVSTASLEVHDLVIRGTLPSRVGETFGRALQVQLGASVVGERVLVADNYEVGMVAAANRSLIQLTDAEITTTHESACTLPSCAHAGIGVGAYITGRIDLSRFRLSTHDLAGAQVAVRGELDLRDGEVSDNPVGVNVQIEGYDFGRLSRNVAYRDNGSNLDSTALPVPDPTAAGGP